MENHYDKSKKLSFKKEAKRAVYTSYNALAGRAEVKSVPQAMHEFISEGFAKLQAAK